MLLRDNAHDVPTRPFASRCRGPLVLAVMLGLTGCATTAKRAIQGGVEGSLEGRSQRRHLEADSRQREDMLLTLARSLASGGQLTPEQERDLMRSAGSSPDEVAPDNRPVSLLGQTSAAGG